MSSNLSNTQQTSDYQTGFFIGDPNVTSAQEKDAQQDVLQSLALFNLIDGEYLMKNPKWGDNQTISLLKMSKTYRIETLEKLCLKLLGIDVVDNKWELTIDSEFKRYPLLKDPFIQNNLFCLKVNALNAKAMDTLFSPSSIVCKNIQSLKLIDCEPLSSDTLKGLDQIYPNIQALTLQGKTVDDTYVKGWFKRYQKSLTYIDVSTSKVTDKFRRVSLGYLFLPKHNHT